MPSSDIVVATRRELESLVRLDLELIAAVELAFVELSRGTIRQPPVMRLDLPERRAEVDVKTAYIPGAELFAIKVSSGFFDNGALGLPSLGGFMSLLDSETGRVRGVLLDDGYLTDLRTA